jgi:lipoprotein-releasing system ATP-binding protein
VHLKGQTEMLRVENLRKVYRSGRSELVVFDNLSFQVAKGEMLAIVGASGSGKSTLLHILGALDAPTSGEVHCAGTRLQELAGDAAADFRNRTIGYVWQFHYLLPEFTAAENVAMPLLARRNGNAVAPSAAMNEAQDWLARVGLADRSHHRAGELSGGEQQRVALARALVTGPQVLFADEPTGDLDSVTADEIFGLIHELHVEKQLTSLIVTHNNGFARRCQRVLRIAAGRVEEVAPATLPG